MPKLTFASVRSQTLPRLFKSSRGIFTRIWSLATPSVFAVLFSIGLAGFASMPTLSEASNVQFVGNAGYSFAGNSAVLTADRVENFDLFGFSGTLKMELWALPSPYTGSFQFGYKLSQYTLGQLSAGFVFNNVSSGTIFFAPPPDGTWRFVMVLTEFTNGPTDSGYDVRDYMNFSVPVVIGSPPAPPPPPPPPPVITPQVGLWWNPNESGTGYALDTKHGVLVVTTYSYTQGGLPLWYISSGPITNNVFSQLLLKTLNGQCISCIYRAPTLNGSDGTMTITFTSATSATMTLPGRASFQIVPQAF